MPNSSGASSTEPTHTERFARFAAGVSYDDLTPEVVHAVRRSVLDSVGVALAARNHEVVDIAIRATQDLGGQGSATVIGRSERADLYNATLVNGMMAHVLDWDDSMYPNRLHLSAAVVPALLAAGEATAASGRDLVVGVAVAFDVAQRLSDAIYPEFGERGWHATGVTGAAATGAAVGTMLSLDEEHMTWALGLGAGLGAGQTSALGSMAKPLILGHAGAAGLQAAHLARRGFTSHPDMFGPAARYLDKYTNTPLYSGLSDDLGSRWAVLANGFKPYPCGMLSHAALDAVRELRGQAPPGSRIETLRVRVSPESIWFMGRTDPKTGLEGKFSVRYEAAVAWVEGDVGPSAFSDDAVRRADYQEAMAGTTIEGVEGTAQQEAFAEVKTTDGWQGKVHVPFARGTIQQPLSDDDLRAKFSAACATGEYEDAETLADAIWRLEELPVTDLARLLSSDPS